MCLIFRTLNCLMLIWLVLLLNKLQLLPQGRHPINRLLLDFYWLLLFMLLNDGLSWVIVSSLLEVVLVSLHFCSTLLLLFCFMHNTILLLWHIMWYIKWLLLWCCFWHHLLHLICLICAGRIHFPIHVISSLHSTSSSYGYFIEGIITWKLFLFLLLLY